MFRIRQVPDDLSSANVAAVRQAQAILRAQFPGMPVEDIDRLPAQLRDPLRYRFVSRLLVAEDGADRQLGLALLLHFPDLDFCYLELISAAPGRTGGGVGAALYQRVREIAVSLGASGIYLECLPDDAALSPDPEVRAQNEARLRFYERYGARPVIGTAYETPLSPGGTDPPYLVLDPLGAEVLPGRDALRRVVRAILERKYGHLCPRSYVTMVLRSIRDEPARLRAPRYARRPGRLASRPQADAVVPVTLVVNDRHDIHHVRDRGYVEAPVRVRTILVELERSGLFRTRAPRRFPEAHIRAVHDGRLVDYMRRACAEAGANRPIYPYVFPLRNRARPPRERTVLAGYYCIDTFTPLNREAWAAARRAVDCTLSAADALLDGRRLAYALVRPPGHHAERTAFGGFCYLCNGAIAANFLSRYGRVAMLDLDYHHGNGQQDIFYQRDDVLTVSVHGHPRFAYPYFTGFREETGRGAGAGYNLNIPLEEHATPEVYRNAVQLALRRIARHAADYLVLSMGFDTGRGDPTGTWANRGADFELIGRLVGACGLPVLVVQEGGYRVRTLGSNARRFFEGLVAGARAALPGGRGGRARRRAAERGAPADAALDWREAVQEGDIEAVRSLVARTGFFNAEEETIAADLVRERIERGAASGYHFLLACEPSGRLAGYACWGPIDGTDGRHDLYWIVVDPLRQRAGFGRELLRRAEQRMVAAGATRVYAETAGREQYGPTRAFYRRCGYRKAAELADFYAEGDAKIIFARDLTGRALVTTRAGPAPRDG